ncbi:sortase domain-containing protein [Virgibacillus natechei]|uniref:class F sortase n=1 Tax=Virgibacillus sp. CBA3643 TaxID=2942278 RepID=UPI0035A39237
MKIMTLFTISGLLCLLLVFGYVSAYSSEQHSEKASDEESEQLSNHANLEEIIDTEAESESSADRDVPLSDEFTLLDSDGEKMDEMNSTSEIIPAEIELPKIDVSAPIENVDILENGEMGVPSEAGNVGWFEPGFKPGNMGSAVLAGHVDSKTGPAIFYDLDELEMGDEIHVTGQEGETLTFVVRKLENYPRDAAPIEEIFGSTDGRSLNLITCTGVFDQSEGTHEERLVVYTELKEEKSDPPPAPDNVEISGDFITWHAVREENIAGYRVYKGSDEDREFEHVASISTHERKTFTDEETGDHSYYITAVNIKGEESEPSEIAVD